MRLLWVLCIGAMGLPCVASANGSMSQARAAVAKWNAKVHADWARRGYPKGDPRVDRERRAIRAQHGRAEIKEVKTSLGELKQMLALTKQLQSTLRDSRGKPPAERARAIQKAERLHAQSSAIHRAGIARERALRTGNNNDWKAFSKRTGRWPCSIR